MLDFRKVLLALSVAGLGLVSTASAQISCTGSLAATAITIRTEGLAEQLPPLTLTGCSGTTNTATVSFTVVTNAPIGNLLLTGTTNNTTDATASISSIGIGASAISGLPANTVAGQLVNSTTLQFTFSTPAAITLAGATITVDNVRVNANAVPVGTQITATIAPVSGFSALSGTLAAAAAFTNASLTASKFTGYNNIAICATSSTAVNVVGTVQIFENFVGAFTTAAQEGAKESVGYAAPVPPATNSNTQIGNPADAATGIVGTTIAVVFNNLVSGVNYYVPASVTSGGLVLTLVSSPTSTTPIAGATIGTAISGGYPGATVANVVQLSSTSGSATAYYMVTGDDGLLDQTAAATAETVVAPATTVTPLAVAGQINLYEIVPTGTTVGTATAVSVSTYLAGNTSTGYPQFAAVTSPTVLSAKANNTGTGSTGLLTSCNTTLIFPYVLTSSGYDTGIELTNAGLGSTVAGNTISTTTNGTCTLTAWGSASFGSAAIPSFALTNSPLAVTAGTVNAFQLSTALPAANNTAFVGYLIASCNFQGAHGFGFVFGGANGSTGGAGLSYGYLAPILTDVFNLAPTAIDADF